MIVLNVLPELLRVRHLQGTPISAYHFLCNVAVCLSISNIDNLCPNNHSIIGMSSMVSNQPKQDSKAIIQKGTRPLGLQNLSKYHLSHHHSYHLHLKLNLSHYPQSFLQNRLSSISIIFLIF